MTLPTILQDIPLGRLFAIILYVAMIFAGVSSLLAKWNVNVLDISQTILQENFTMVMLADLENCSLSFTELTEKLSALGAEMNIAIRMQREDIFNAMHKI